MSRNKNQREGWLHRPVHWSIAYLSVLTVGSIGAIETVKVYDERVDTKIFEDKRDLANLQSDLLYSRYASTEQKLQAVGQEAAANNQLEVYCGIPNQENPLWAGIHHDSPNSAASFVTLNYLFCDAVEKASRPDFEPNGPYPSDVQASAAESGVFVFAHEVGHDIVGSSEIAANCYAASNYRNFAQALGMPEVVVEAPQNSEKYCS